MHATERWLPVRGWEGLYEVSDHGRVRSLPRLSTKRKRYYGGQVLTPSRWSGSYGYAGVVLWHGDRHQACFIHRLVLEAFVGPRPPGHEACHGPRGGQDDSLDNLRWGTRASNTADRFRDGTVLRGVDNGYARLTEEAVRQIRKRYADGGTTMRQLADLYGVGVTAVYMVIHRATWRHVA